jgi:hypothetical protein
MSCRTLIAAAFLAFATTALGAETRAHLPYRFGLSKEAVKKQAACSPYTDVAATGGVECANFVLDRKRNVSLVFTNDHLSKVQVWFAEAAQRPAAVKAVDELLAYLTKNYGAVDSPVIVGREVTTGALFATLDRVPLTSGAKVQVKPRYSPSDAFVFATIIRDPRFGYYVFLYFQPPL